MKFRLTSYPDGESFPLAGASSVVLHVEKGLVPLVDHQPYGVGQTVAGAAFVPARVNNITLGLNLGRKLYYMFTFLLFYNYLDSLEGTRK